MEAVVGRHWDQWLDATPTDKSCFEGSGRQHWELAPKNSDSVLADKPRLDCLRTDRGISLIILWRQCGMGTNCCFGSLYTPWRWRRQRSSSAGGSCPNFCQRRDGGAFIRPLVLSGMVLTLELVALGFAVPHSATVAVLVCSGSHHLHGRAHDSESI